MDLTIERFDLDASVREPNTRRPTPPGQIIPTDFPFIVDDETQTLVEPLNLFLLHKFNGGNAYRGPVWTKENSARAAAEDLKVWWKFMHDHPAHVSWDNVSDHILSSYLQALSRVPSVKTGDHLAAGTIKRHCSSIDAFNGFASAKWPKGTFPSMGAAKILAGFAGTAPKHETDELPRPLTDENVRAVNEALGPMPTKRIKRQSSRTRLAFALAVQVGLRIDEIVNLRASTFRDMKINPARPMGAVVLRITKTKGLVPRDAYFPNWLVLELKSYIANERAESVERGMKLWIKDETDIPWELLLNRPDARGRGAGKAATPDSIEEDFNKAIKALDLTIPREILSGTDKATVIDVPKHVFHDGRHTYAHMTFSGMLLQKKPVEAAWMLLKLRLGHAHVKTTIDTYLRAFSEVSETEVELLVEHLRSLEEEAAL